MKRFSSSRHLAAAGVMLALVVAAGMGFCAVPDREPARLLLCRFVGEFVSSGLPRGPARAIPLDLIDAEFLVVVRVREIREGRLPDGGGELVAFAIHSPTQFFVGQGLDRPEGRDVPPGRFLFSLWRLPEEERFALDIVQADPVVSSQAISQVAQRYYALLDAAAVQEAPEDERSQRAIWHGDVVMPPDATGMVVDREGRPVAGAQVEVGTKTETARGETGADGRFRIPLSDRSNGNMDLTVTAPGYERWAYTGLYGGLIDKRVQLSRTIDNGFLAAVAAETLPERRMWLLLEIVGDRPGASSLAPMAVFPAIGSLRADLRALIAAKAFARNDDMVDSPVERARQLLAWWCDPEDADLLAGWRKKHQSWRTDPGDISAAQAFGVCTQWAEKHFRNEGVADRQPWYSCQPLAVDPSGTHTLLRFEVRYAYWGYSHLLVAVREAGTWHLRLVTDWEHFHMRDG